jgi:hypothetical protein
MEQGIFKTQNEVFIYSRRCTKHSAPFEIALGYLLGYQLLKTILVGAEPLEDYHRMGTVADFALTSPRHSLYKGLSIDDISSKIHLAGKCLLTRQ